MVIRLADNHFNEIYEIINDAASAYTGIIPGDRWHIPYMSQDELKSQIGEGVEFWGYLEKNLLLGKAGKRNQKVYLW